MMKVMNITGRKSVTFIFAGYKKEMDEFVQVGRNKSLTNAYPINHPG